MNCTGFEKIVLALARHQLLDIATRQQGLAHAESCVRCGGRLAEEQALMIGVRAVIAEVAREEAPARLEATLLAAFRQHTAVSVTPVVPATSIKRRHESRWQFGAVAAGVLALIAFLVFYWSQSASSSHQRPEQVERTLSPAAPEPQAPRSVPQAQLPEQRIVDQQVSQLAQRRVRNRTAEERESEEEFVTEFFPLLDEDDLGLLEDAQIVRVELPGSALLAIGLPVDPEITDEPVKADVVLGYDGLARAIRFVR